MPVAGAFFFKINSTLNLDLSKYSGIKQAFSCSEHFKHTAFIIVLSSNGSSRKPRATRVGDIKGEQNAQRLRSREAFPHCLCNRIKEIVKADI